jgi:S-formylglutathione hydrolase
MSEWKRRLRLFLLLAAAAAAGCGSREGQLFEKTIPAPSLRGNLVGEPAVQPIAVYLPPSYASTSDRYPVVYYLPGYNTPVTALFDGRYQGLSLVQSMDSLVAAGMVSEMIVVVVNGRSVLGGSFFANSPVTGNWEDFLVRDVVRYVDRNYKTMAYPAMRGITGHSAGATAALHVAMSHPDVFSGVYALSPGLFAGRGVAVSAVLGGGRIEKAMRDKRDDLAVLPREDAQAAFASYIHGLLDSGDRRDEELAFAYAYGAAFSPDPEGIAPYVSLPDSGSEGPATADTLVWSKWDSGFGGVDRRISSYLGGSAKLKAIAVEIGAGEPDKWMLDGCEYFSERLDEAGIPHDMIVFDGGHEDELRQRIEEHMLPFFSGVFALE